MKQLYFAYIYCLVDADIFILTFVLKCLWPSPGLGNILFYRYYRFIKSPMKCMLFTSFQFSYMCYVYKQMLISKWIPLKLQYVHASKRVLFVAWDWLGSKSAAAISASAGFILFVVAFWFLAQFELKWNGCRESCSGVNWSASARARADWWRRLQTLLLAEASQSTVS